MVVALIVGIGTVAGAILAAATAPVSP
jgi:hypothetical protein